MPINNIQDIVITDNDELWLENDELLVWYYDDEGNFTRTPEVWDEIDFELVRYGTGEVKVYMPLKYKNLDKAISEKVTMYCDYMYQGLTEHDIVPDDVSNDNGFAVIGMEERILILDNSFDKNNKSAQ